jgi:hypothetical protein
VIRAATVLVALAVFAGVATASDGGSGTYTATGSTYYFVFFNGGTTAWQYFYVVGPPGTRFAGGGTISEASPRCAVGEPDGRPDEIECGPLPASLATPQVHFGFGATLASPAPCGSSFQLYVSATGALPFTRVGDAVFAGSCAATRLHAVTPPAIQGFASVGHTLSATPPGWSATPSHVSYVWQRCLKQACSGIRGATKLRLVLTKRDRGHAVRLVATAALDGVTAVSRSGKLAVR